MRKIRDDIELWQYVPKNVKREMYKGLGLLGGIFGSLGFAVGWIIFH